MSGFPSKAAGMSEISNMAWHGSLQGLSRWFRHLNHLDCHRQCQVEALN